MERAEGGKELTQERAEGKKPYGQKSLALLLLLSACRS
jgi:hypothetical protein